MLVIFPKSSSLVFQGVGLVVCGDDKGSLWLYNMPTMIQVLLPYRRNVARDVVQVSFTPVTDLPRAYQEGGRPHHTPHVARATG